MKLCDVEKFGNIVRLYYTDDNVNDYWGDDWDDIPYEHNAGIVSSEYVPYVEEIAFPTEWFYILEPCDGTYNSCYSKEDMRDCKVPCLIVVDKTIDDWRLEDNFSFALGFNSQYVKQIYFNDSWDYIHSILFSSDKHYPMTIFTKEV
jgi:hypothetical protein